MTKPKPHKKLRMWLPIVFLISCSLVILTIFMPLFASYGGRWGFIRYNLAVPLSDSRYFPQSKLFPVDVILYLVVLCMLVWAIKKTKHIKRLILLCIAIYLMPAVWAIVAIGVGFKYNACHIPAGSLQPCHNPASFIGVCLLYQAFLLAIVLTCLLVGKKKGVSVI